MKSKTEAKIALLKQFDQVFAHVEDFESINDASRRADCERLALNFAKMLLKERRKFQSISEVVLAIQKSQ
ncbi:hypothetical protein AgCh_036450 [Apium graveolens]